MGGTAVRTAGEAATSKHLTLAGLLEAVEFVDASIDAVAAPEYLAQPLALDWARITKVCEEAGEVWQALNGIPGELPGELGDVVSAGLCAVQHITKDANETRGVISAALTGRRYHVTLEELLQAVELTDTRLDAEMGPGYRAQPLALHWARVTEVCGRAGEVWQALSRLTGENPRKGVCGTREELLGKLGGAVSAATCAIQHLTKDAGETWAVVCAALVKARQRTATYRAATETVRAGVHNAANG